MSRESRICATGLQAGMTTLAAGSLRTLPAMKPQMTHDQRIRREADSLLEVPGETKCGYRWHSGVASHTQNQAATPRSWWTSALHRVHDFGEEKPRLGRDRPSWIGLLNRSCGRLRRAT